MQPVGLGKYWQDSSVGETFKTIGRTITETDMINFINCTGLSTVPVYRHDRVDV